MTLVPPGVRWKVINRDRHRCQHCGDSIDFEHFEEYTILLRADNGSREKWLTRPSNLVLVCRPCSEWLEVLPDEAYTSGFRVDGVHPANVPIHTISRGLVLLEDNGFCVSQQVDF